MTLFIIIVIRDLGKVFLKAFRLYIIGDYIISSSRSTRAGVLLLTFLFLKPLFGLFSSFFKDFYIARGIVYRLGFLGFFQLLDLKIFYGSALGLYLGCSNVNMIIILLSLLIYLQNIGKRLEIYFGLNFNRFFNYLFLNI